MHSCFGSWWWQSKRRGKILKRTEELIKQGVKGIVYGRNIIQHPNPAKIIKVLMGMVHDNFTAAQALELLK